MLNFFFRLCSSQKEFSLSSNGQAQLIVPSEENKVFTYSAMFHPNQTRAFP
jgi:hypothetical protein